VSVCYTVCPGDESKIVFMSNWKKTFIIIWTGQLFSTLSSAVVGFAVMFWLSISTGSAEVLAYAIIAALLPQLILGFFTGVYVDRWNRKLTMIIADLFIALCTLVIAILLFLGEKDITYFYVLLALRSVGTAFHIPALQASVPLLAPEDKLMRIAGVNNIIQSIGNIAGPALAALLISLFDLTWVLMIDVAGAIIACVSLLMVHIPDPDKSNAPPPNVVDELVVGMREIYSKPGLFWMFILAILATFFIMPVAALFPLMTLNHFSGNTFHMSIIEIAWGIGMLLGGAIMGFPKLRTYKIILINLMYLLLGLTFLFSGILPRSGFVYFATITIFGGISMSIYSGSFNVVLQTMVDPSALGRVFSMYGSITLLPAMVGLLATGYIADNIGIGNAFVISGIAIGALGLLAFLVPAVAKMVKEEVSSGGNAVSL
jgi:DHA3 family macrolide efflux protein-like MFS transporter